MEDSDMLANAVVCAAVPVTDVERARRFYAGTLGLAEASLGDPDESFCRAGDRTMLHIYEGPSRTAATGHTVATFLVENLVEEVAALRARGAQFEEYDSPGLTTEDGVFSRQDGFKAAWIRDPEGNILSLEQLAAQSGASGAPR
jgi:catechol 2,3-dioxygenase-like lactoylglutathione lyase family enzyme